MSASCATSSTANLSSMYFLATALMSPVNDPTSCSKFLCFSVFFISITSYSRRPFAARPRGRGRQRGSSQKQNIRQVQDSPLDAPCHRSRIMKDTANTRDFWLVAERPCPPSSIKEGRIRTTGGASADVAKSRWTGLIGQLT